MESMPPPIPERPAIKTILAGDPVPADRKAGMSEKQLADLLAPMAGLSGNLLLLSMKASEALGERMNFKTGKKREQVFSAGYVPVVRAMALALGSLKNEMTAAFDTPRGAVIEAKMNADFLSLGGQMLFTLEEIQPGQVKITGLSEIKGQMFDWGKGDRAMKAVIDKATQYLSLLA